MKRCTFYNCSRNHILKIVTKSINTYDSKVHTYIVFLFSWFSLFNPHMVLERFVDKYAMYITSIDSDNQYNYMWKMIIMLILKTTNLKGIVNGYETITSTKPELSHSKSKDLYELSTCWSCSISWMYMNNVE